MTRSSETCGLQCHQARREEGGVQRSKERLFCFLSFPAFPHPGPIASSCCFVHACMRTTPARSAQHSATSVSACGSGPGLRTCGTQRAVPKSNQARHRGHSQGCLDPIQSTGGHLPWRVAVGPISRLQRRMQGWRSRKSKGSWL